MDKQPKIAVDGGVNTKTIQQLKNCGAEIFCVGSAITMSSNPQESYNELKNLI
jgi:3-keto-L-gulonate-6-phosphate decarboxylase